MRCKGELRAKYKFFRTTLAYRLRIEYNVYLYTHFFWIIMPRKEVPAMQKGRAKSLPARTITYMALLIALQVVLGSLLQIPIGNSKQLNLGFLPIATAGVLMGPLAAMMVGALGDIVGTLLFPTGAYYFGFTLTNMIVGLLYGMILKRGKKDALSDNLNSQDQEQLVRAVIASFLVSMVYLSLNSLWLSFLYGSKTYMGWVMVRAATNLIEIPVSSALIYLLQKALLRLPNELLPEGAARVGAKETNDKRAES